MAKTKTSFAQVLQDLEEKKQKKLRVKLPLWADTEGVSSSDELALEQCSSESAARFKAELLARVLPCHKSIADLTGGLGSDSWAFSEQFENVYYFERQKELCDCAENNFQSLCRRLGKEKNIVVRNMEINSSSLASLSELKADCIYLDPARRDKEGKKVFLIEDCSPNLLELLPELEALSPYLLVKYSPMADISMLRKRIGEALGSHKLLSSGIISLRGEVKEVLLLIGAERLEVPELFISELAWKEKRIVGLKKPEKAGRFYSEGSPRYLLEPTAALLKAGCQDLACEIWQAEKLSPDCHLYLSDKCEGEHKELYKTFEIIEIAAFSKASIQDFSRRYPRGEASAKGIGLSSEELTKRLKCKSGLAQDGSHYHIFGAQGLKGKLLIAGRRL